MVRQAKALRTVLKLGMERVVLSSRRSVRLTQSGLRSATQAAQPDALQALLTVRHTPLVLRLVLTT